MTYINELIDWIKKEVNKANAKGVVVGISGGIDSAFVAYLAKKAFPNNSLGVLIPINSKRQIDLKDGEELVNQLNIKSLTINLEKEYLNLKEKLDINNNLICGNLQSRLRMLTLYSIAQKNNYLVLGTDNKSEYELGYFTKYGDGGCDLLPIVNLYKSEIFEYAKKLNLPTSIINKKPTAGFWDEQEDEKELGFSYEEYEKYCKNKLKDKKIVEKIEKQIKITNHKRKPIPKPPKRKEEEWKKY